MNRLGLNFVLLAAALWATVGVATGLVPEQSRWPAEILALSRTILAGPLLLGVAALMQGLTAQKFRNLHLPSLLLFAGACAVFQICLFRSFQVIGVTLTVFLTVVLPPIFAMCWSRLTGREPATWRDAMALVIAVAGLCLFFVPDIGAVADRIWWIGGPLCVVGALAFVVMSKAARSLSATSSAMIASGSGLTLSAGFLIFYVLLSGDYEMATLARIQLDTASISLALYLALFPTALAYILFTAGMARCRTAAVGVIATMVEPVIAAALAVWLIGEQLSVLQFAGCAALTCVPVLLWLDRGAPVSRPSPGVLVRPGP